MSDFSGYPVRPENFMVIADEILSSRIPRSKAQIAELTGFSIMTVGKVSDELQRAGLIEMTKDEAGDAGRKAVLISPNPEIQIASAELSEGSVALSLYSIVPELIARKTAEADTDDGMAIFTALNTLCADARPACCVIVADGLLYDAETGRISSVGTAAGDIGEIISGALMTNVLFASDRKSAEAMSEAEDFDGNVFYVNTGSKFSRVISGGELQKHGDISLLGFFPQDSESLSFIISAAARLCLAEVVKIKTENNDLFRAISAACAPVRTEAVSKDPISYPIKIARERLIGRLIRRGRNL